MKSCSALPDGYTELYSVDLQKNKKMSVLVNAIAVLIAVVMVVPMVVDHFLLGHRSSSLLVDVQDPWVTSFLSSDFAQKKAGQSF